MTRRPRTVHPGFSTYRHLWSTPGVPPLLAGFSLARVPTGMVALTFTLSTLQSTKSLSLAGLVTACYAIAMGVGMPIIGRLVDRRGPVQALVLTGALYPLSLLLFAGSVLGWVHTPLWVLPAAAAAAGALLPPVAPVVRTVWVDLLDREALHAANVVESLLTQVFYIVGPAVVGLLAIWKLTPLALIASVVLNAAGVVLVLASRDVRRLPGNPEPTRRLAALRQPGIAAVLLLAAGWAVGSQGMDFGVISWADERGNPGLAGIALATATVGGLLAAVAYGVGKPVLTGITLRSWFAAWALTLAVLGVVTSSHGHPVLVFAAALLVEAVSAPIIVLLLQRATEVATAGLRTETFSWRMSALMVGSAVGASICGAATKPLGTAGPALIGVVCAVLAAIVAARVGRPRQAATTRRGPAAGDTDSEIDGDLPVPGRSVATTSMRSAR